MVRSSPETHGYRNGYADFEVIAGGLISCLNLKTPYVLPIGRTPVQFLPGPKRHAPWRRILSMDLREVKSLSSNYEQGPAVLFAALAEAPEFARKWRPNPDSWSIHEIICHCADSETYAATRLRLLLAEPEPLIVGYDQVNWTAFFDYHSLPLEPSLAAVNAVRANTAPLVHNLTADDLRKVGRHTESGPYGIHDWLRTYGFHLHDHAEQIRENLNQWNAAGKPGNEKE